MGELVERVDEHDRVLGVVDRDEAIANRLLHRVATTVCRDPEGRILVHRRQRHLSRFPGQYNDEPAWSRHRRGGHSGDVVGAPAQRIQGRGLRRVSSRGRCAATREPVQGC